MSIVTTYATVFSTAKLRLGLMRAESKGECLLGFRGNVAYLVESSSSTLYLLYLRKPFGDGREDINVKWHVFLIDRLTRRELFKGTGFVAED